MEDDTTMDEIDPQTTVADIVADDDRTASVFFQHGIDFCCQGDRTLASACEGADVPLEEVVADIKEAAGEGQPGPDVEGFSLPRLTDYIEEEHHAYTRAALPEILTYADKVARVHGDAHPETREIASICGALQQDMEEHMQREEAALFPAVRALDDGTSQGAAAARVRELVDPLEDDHDATAELLERLEHLTDGYQPPEDACRTYRVLYARLERFDEKTKRHVHAENHVLFPRALEQATPEARS